MTPTKDGYVLSTGRTFSANCGIIGISPKFISGSLSHGYDGGINCGLDPWDEDEDVWTPEERKELADYMIALWKKWRDTFGVQQ